MQIAERLSKIQPSMTLAINNRAQEMRANGIDVLSLAVGEPDFPTPDFIKQAAKKAIDENFTRYTQVAGIPGLRKAAGNFFQRHYGVPVGPECIIMGAGGKQCLYTLIQATINPGDEVLIPSPYWVSYPDMVLLAGAVPVFVPASLEDDFKINPQLLEKKLNKKTRALILNSPSNPTGAVYEARELEAILDWAKNNGIYVISDEIYDQLVFPAAKMASAIGRFATNPEDVAVLNGLSKSYAMTGWRVGFMAAHPEIIKKMSVIQGHSLSNVCSVAQKAALAALEGPDSCVEEMRKAFEKRRDLAIGIVSGWKNTTCPMPMGAFYIFPDVHGCYNEKIRNSLELSSFILEEAHVAVVPGIAFGNDNCIRLSYAVADKALEQALTKIGEVLHKLN